MVQHVLVVIHTKKFTLILTSTQMVIIEMVVGVVMYRQLPGILRVRYLVDSILCVVSYNRA